MKVSGKILFQSIFPLYKIDFSTKINRKQTLKKVGKLSNKNLLTGLRDRLSYLFILIISNLPFCHYGYNAALLVGVLTLDADMDVFSCDFLK